MTSSAHERRDTVHAEGALLGIELNDAGRVARAAVSGFTPVAPSAVAYLVSNRAPVPTERQLLGASWQAPTSSRSTPRTAT
jgi:2,4-dienoyl-CoA reductase-like NADH-dependent reductase (Old Yellow Enzyme family)